MRHEDKSGGKHGKPKTRRVTERPFHERFDSMLRGEGTVYQLLGDGVVRTPTYDGGRVDNGCMGF